MLTRREILAAPAAAAALSAQPSKQRPNVILFCVDDLGGGDLGCQGAKDLKTPHIDSLAAAGTRFTNWYSNAPVCAPARGALMTGRYPARNGVHTNGRELAAGQKTIAEFLKPAGYRTGLVGKWHLGSGEGTSPNAHGFDYFYGFHSGCVDFYSHRYYWGEPNRVNYHDLWRNRTEVFDDGQYLTDRIGEEACGFIDGAGGKPFFLYAAFNAPHYPMHAPKKYVDRFRGLDPERAVYAAMIAAVDDAVGRIVDRVKRAGHLENTLIFFVSDNGATREPRAGLNGQAATAGRNADFRGFKFSLFDGGMHVPGIINWPGVVPGGHVSTEVVVSMDVMPTICKAAGLAIPADYTLDGRDVLPVAKGEAKSPHGAVFWANGPQRAVRQGRWKLIRNPIEHDYAKPDGRKPFGGDDAVFLADLEKDPGERVNVRRQNPEVVDELLTLLERWERELPLPR